MTSDYENEPLRSDPLELADTRPQMIWFWFVGEVPVPAAAIILSGFGFLMAATGSWYWLLPIAPVWWTASQLIAADYHMFTRVQLWLNTSFWGLDTAAEGGASVTPFPVNETAASAVRAALGLRAARGRGIA